MRFVVASLSALALLVLLPGVLAQTPLLEDPAGDVEMRAYDNVQPAPAEWNAVDLTALAATETEHGLELHVTLAGLPDCQQEVCPNSGDTRTYLWYGGIGYMVQTGLDATGHPYGRLFTNVTNTWNLRFQSVLNATLDESTTTLTVQVPRDMMLDATGSPLRGGRTITNIWSHAYSQFSFGGPDPNNLGQPTEAVVVIDEMGIDAPTQLLLTRGGSAWQGDVWMDSLVPYRASNGGAADLEYTLLVRNSADRALVATFDVIGGPSDWNFTHPDAVDLPPGEHTVKLRVQTPFGHQHGGSQSFRFHMDILGSDDFAWTELGIHYLDIPQPAGHHDTVYLHSWAVQAPFGAVNLALGGSDGSLFMNTQEDDEKDQDVPVQGYRGGFGIMDRFHWSICLDPVLELGLDFNLDETGELKIPIQTTVPMQGARLTGDVLVLGPGDKINSCFPSSYSDRDQMTVATIVPGEPRDIADFAILEATMEANEAGDYVPFKQGQQLVVELRLELAVPTPPSPAQASIAPGGTIRFPLDEYMDEAPAGVIVPLEEPPAPEAPELEAPAPQEKESPSVGLLLVPALAAIALRRRQIIENGEVA